MKTEISLSSTTDMVIENVLRPAMVNELTGAAPAARRPAPQAEPEVKRLHILARRQERWDRRAARA
ncbi:hypothetical protein K1X12_01930 [Hyphomonas sp. WL0036]|uniref:hypothetical protein n=1 Tax=Hyphomonas sediminis TaxID=2866160 RepID=UPI001C827335|nr:hypothetical protein [Hyphomonas sediminis]MBY9065638.1 hypothetical protein [Hyphomonas sediminis]